MSAFFVGEDHINAMLTVAASLKSRFPLPPGEWGITEWGKTPEDNTLTMIGRALIKENIASLAARYPSDYTEMFNCDPDQFVFEEDGSVAVSPNIYKLGITASSCYDYQSCEHDGWKISYAAKFTNWLTVACARKLAGEGWNYEKPANAPKIVNLSRLLAGKA